MEQISGTVNCDTCGHEQRLPESTQNHGERYCDRCGKLLWRDSETAHLTAFSLTLCGAVLFLPTLLLPLVTLSKFGNQRISYFLPQVWSLAANEYGLLASALLVCAMAAPLLLLLLMVLLELQNRFGIFNQLRKPLALLANKIEPWSMPEVYLLSIVIAYFKLSEFIDFRLGLAFWTYCALSIFLLGAWRQFSLLPANLVSRREAVRQANQGSIVWAQLICAIILLVPAYLVPVMSTSSVGEAAVERTILNGIMSLARSGHWPLAIIVLVASVLVPFFKIVGLGWLLIRRKSSTKEQAYFKTRLYELIDFSGRWSMLDVFLVAFLAGTVHFGQLARIEPRPGILAFAGVVIFTMLAARTFDPRSIWEDKFEPEHKTPS